MVLSTDSQTMPRRPKDVFGKKIKHNFKLYVLLYLKGSNWNRQDVLLKIYRLGGYMRHKVVKHGVHWSHLHIKFSEEQYAKEAVDYFTSLNSDLTAMLVDELLRAWYYFENRAAKCGHTWTLTIVDIVGSTPMSLNFLTENLLNCIFQDFGRPYVLPYTAAVSGAHQQVLFNSMTEALAACMAFGQWYVVNGKADEFFYRVRINPSSKEGMLIQDCTGVPREAFKLDYFVSKKAEINRNKETNIGTGAKQGAVSQKFGGNVFQNETQRACKQKHEDFRPQQSEAMKYGAHFMFYPRTPIPNSYSQALMGTRNPENPNYAGRNLQIAYPQAAGPAASAEAVDEVKNSLNSFDKNVAMHEFVGNATQQAQTLADETSTSTRNNVLNSCQSLPLASNSSHRPQRQKRSFRLSSRIFERRKCSQQT